MNTNYLYGKRIISLFVAFSVFMTMTPNLSIAAYVDDNNAQSDDSAINNNDTLGSDVEYYDTYNYPVVTSAPIEEDIPELMLYSSNSSTLDTMLSLSDSSSADTLLGLSDVEDQVSTYEYNGSTYSVFDIGLSWTQSRRTNIRNRKAFTARKSVYVLDGWLS